MTVIGFGQENLTGAKVVTTSAQVAQNINANETYYTLQVGVPFINTTTPNLEYDIRFPWDILYLFRTFEEDFFDVSKGFFSDKIVINWQLKSNYDLINNIEVYRREYNEDNTNLWQLINTISKDENQYEDEVVEGGVLYEYKILATGVNNDEIRYQNFITGIGYRNPTATVTGNISYEGGNPVKDVTVRAEAQGSALDLGSALLIPQNRALQLRDMSREIDTSMVFQAWVKPQSAFDTGSSPIQLFNLIEGSNQSFSASLFFDNQTDEIEIDVDGLIFKVKDFIPTGEVNSLGEDILIPITDVNSSFTHFSIIVRDNQSPELLINGRAISTAYQTNINAIENIDENGIITNPYGSFAVTIPTAVSDLSVTGSWNNVDIGGGKDAIVDEIRIWNQSISEQKIRTDFKRYISGNDNRLISYLRANENTGNFAYDLSRSGFTYNKNHGRLKQNSNETSPVTWISGAGNVPDADQLGVLGITDENGNYEITSIPYTGTGESFTITPLFGLHQFQPNQQLVFLGEGSVVVNQVNFTDISSFVFKGRVLYDVRGVFPSFAEADEDPTQSVTAVGVLDNGYNEYNILGQKYRYGQYWLNEGDPDDPADDVLDIYSTVGLEGAQVYIDGQIVLDENNAPVLTDANGAFEISVPIGEHFIRIEKNGHTLLYEGRYPKTPGSTIEFFEDSQKEITFIDTTRVTVIGRVVGGAVEAQKPIGFGDQEPFEVTYQDEEGNSQNFEVSSKNNIGTASIRYDYQPNEGNVTNKTQFNFTTNPETGEYRVEVMPLNYTLSSSLNPGISINSNTSLSFLESDEPLIYNSVPPLVTPEFDAPDGQLYAGQDYHFEQSFIYRSNPTIAVVEQSSEDFIELDGNDIDTSNFSQLFFNQFEPYELVIDAFEEYTNFEMLGDDGLPITDRVPIIDGQPSINNNFALAGSVVEEVNPNNPSQWIHSFRAGLPNISTFEKQITIDYVIDGIPYPADSNTFNDTGIILGGDSDGSQTFFTAAPDIPDIILRDPPGSNSFASISQGQSITLSTSSSVNAFGGGTNAIKTLFGVKTETGGGLAGPVFESENTNSLTGEISLSTSSKTGDNLTKTYTFNQSISTSDSPDFVGADGDLYIGNSKNYAYGTYFNVQTSSTNIPSANGSTPLSLSYTDDDGNPQTLYISTQKALYFNEEPSQTFFVYSQKFIRETLIPDIEQIIFNLENGILSPDDPGVESVEFYEQQINLWRTVILNNEQYKYDVINNRDDLLADLNSNINNFTQALEDAINDAEESSIYKNRLINNLNNVSSFENLVLSQFENNISFDAGVGEITNSVETVIIDTNTQEFSLNLEESVTLELGAAVNKMGFLQTTTGVTSQDLDAAFSDEETTTVNISYTLKDNDPANFLSVDVVNLFDGNGPVFSTLGGQTSCPYEGEELSHYYNQGFYDTHLAALAAFEAANPDDLFADGRPVYIADDLDENDREALSFATLSSEVPLISVQGATDLFNIPESSNAEYTLLLQNNAIAQNGNTAFLLRVDNNPLNAIINIADNGTVISVPTGQTIPYSLTLAKSISDENIYGPIKIILESLCDSSIFSEVEISAEFVPSCSQVQLTTPLENWVFNKSAAFNPDGTSNAINITATGYNTSFANFQKVDIEYRPSGTSTWTRLQTYYSTQEFLDEAILNGQTQVSLIDGPDLIYSFDIIGLSLQDGNYELRARSTCTNGTEFISEVIPGRVDLNSPRRFGTPSPGDGILSAGEDIMARFSEDVFFNSAVSQIEIIGQTNQLPIDNSVSVYFEGTSNTMEIENPRIVTGDFSLQFWMNHSTLGSATIINQENGINLSINNSQLTFSIAGISASGTIFNDDLFHYYTLTYNNSTGELQIFEDDAVVGSVTGVPNADFTNSNPLIIGGNSFIGNIHSLRLWNKVFNLQDHGATSTAQLVGNEFNLLGFWPMDEGRGDIAFDLAYFNHAQVNADWDIKPKGDSYKFENGQYLEFDNVGLVQLTSEMDATISFWIKTSVPQVATIFSNGRGNSDDLVQSNGLRDKWAINMTASGQLTFESENNSYPIVNANLADGNWHHIAMLLNRNGSLRTYVDQNQVSSLPTQNIGGFSGNKAWLGARGLSNLDGSETIDQEFNGNIDEFRLWTSLRSVEQINRDQYNEMDFVTTGLVLYSRLNEPENVQPNVGPLYYHVTTNQNIIPTASLLNTGTLNYDDDVPPIKPARELINFVVDHVINGDEIILTPVVTDLAAIEGQVLDITVHRLFDSANNEQESPVTWTAFFQQNPVKWYAEGFDEIIDIVKQSDESVTFNFVLVNSGGNIQPFNISNVPSYINLSQVSGNIQPNSQLTITATVDDQVAVGEYQNNFYLETDFGYNQVLQLDLRVLGEEPDWDVNPNDYDYSMNVVGKISVDNIFSEDTYDRIGAFVDGQVRGSANIIYEENFQDYFVFLTVYSNNVSGENIEFKIYDASEGDVLVANINGAPGIGFNDNSIIGSLSNFTLFENTNIREQTISFNQGWTWISFNVEDQNFSDLDALTSGMTLQSNDRIKSIKPTLQYIYTASGNNSGWSGTSTDDSGNVVQNPVLSADYMYKVFLSQDQDLTIEGVPTDVQNWTFPIEAGWNHLPYILKENFTLNNALANYNAQDGDVIKSQNLFAIYDNLNGWSGTLEYLQVGQGFMLKSASAQSFQYPEVFARPANDPASHSHPSISSDFAMYDDNMNAVVKLPDGYNELFILDSNHTLQGKGVIQTVGEKQLSYITIFGESDEKLTFYISNGEEMIETNSSLIFKADLVLGNYFDPLVIELTDNMVNQPMIYPNPFNDQIFIEINSAIKDNVRIEIFSLTGQLLYKDKVDLKRGKNQFELNPELSNGTYMLKTQTQSDVSIIKIIKE
jgi:hypothetical protein